MALCTHSCVQCVCVVSPSPSLFLFFSIHCHHRHGTPSQQRLNTRPHTHHTNSRPTAERVRAKGKRRQESSRGARRPGVPTTPISRRHTHLHGLNLGLGRHRSETLYTQKTRTKTRRRRHENETLQHAQQRCGGFEGPLRPPPDLKPPVFPGHGSVSHVCAVCGKETTKNRPGRSPDARNTLPPLPPSSGGKTAQRAAARRRVPGPVLGPETVAQRVTGGFGERRGAKHTLRRTAMPATCRRGHSRQWSLM